MTDVEPRVRNALDGLVPPPSAARADWEDVRRRAGADGRRRRLAAAAVAAALAAGVAVSPLGGAISDKLGGFSDWLTGTPGEDAPSRTQREFEQAGRFPGNPRLRQLLKVELDGRTFFLHGFETGDVVCLRSAVRSREGAGPQAACVSRADLRRSGDLVLPVKANLSVGRVGPLPRSGDDPPTVPKYLLTFGLAAAEVTTVSVETDRGTSAAAVEKGAFLHVLVPGRRGVWARSVRATAQGGRTQVVPLSLHVGGQPELRTGLRPRGPAVVEREVKRGTIGWLERREPRGVSARVGGLRDCCSGFVRVVYPDPSDFLAVAIGDRTMVSEHMRGSIRSRLGADAVCIGLVSRGGVGTRCGDGLFESGPLDLSWGFSGGGQQLWIVSGVASDQVDRITVFLGDGERWDAPLRHNATAFRIQRAKFPARIVGYDAAGRVIAVQTIRG